MPSSMRRSITSASSSVFRPRRLRGAFISPVQSCEPVRMHVALEFSALFRRPRPLVQQDVQRRVRELRPLPGAVSADCAAPPARGPARHGHRPPFNRGRKDSAPAFCAEGPVTSKDARLSSLPTGRRVSGSSPPESCLRHGDYSLHVAGPRLGQTLCSLPRSSPTTCRSA